MYLEIKIRAEGEIIGEEAYTERDGKEIRGRNGENKYHMLWL